MCSYLSFFCMAYRSDVQIGLNPLKPNSSNYYTLPSGRNPRFWISDIRALCARMSEIKNGGLDQYGAEHSKYDRMMRLGFKGLNVQNIDKNNQVVKNRLYINIYMYNCKINSVTGTGNRR